MKERNKKAEDTIIKLADGSEQAVGDEKLQNIASLKEGRSLQRKKMKAIFPTSSLKRFQRFQREKRMRTVIER